MLSRDFKNRIYRSLGLIRFNFILKIVVFICLLSFPGHSYSMARVDSLGLLSKLVHQHINFGLLNKADSINSILYKKSLQAKNNYYKHLSNIHRMRIIFNKGVPRTYPVDTEYASRNNIKDMGLLFYYYYTLSSFYVFSPVQSMKYYDKALDSPEITNNFELESLRRFVKLYKLCFYTSKDEYTLEGHEVPKDEIILYTFKQIRNDFDEYPSHFKSLYYTYKYYYSLATPKNYFNRSYLDSLEYTILNTPNIKGQLDLLNCRARILSDGGEYDKELQYRKKIDSLSKLVDLGFYPYLNYFNYSKCYLNLSQPDSALVYIQKSLPYLKTNLMNQNRNLLLISSIHDRLGNTDSAEYYHVKYYTYNDSLKNQYLIELSQYINDDIVHSIEKEKLEVSSKANYYSNLSLSFFSLFLVFFVAYIFTYRNQIELKKKSLVINNNNQKMSTLIQLVSHDLKTPFNSIRFLANELQDEKQEDADKVNNLEFYLAQTSDKIREKLNYLSFIFDPFENMAFEFDKEYVTLEECVNESSIHQQTKNSWIDVNSILNRNYADGIKLFVNKRLFVVVLQNLIDNAIQYSKSNQSPKIEIQCERINQNQLITITDYGIGIKKEYLSVIFDKGISWSYKQNNSVNSGVGLYVCKRIIEEFHKGSITCFSVEGNHTSFVISIPAK